MYRLVKILPLIKFFSFNRIIFTKPRKNQKTKTFQRMFGLRLMFFFSSFFFLSYNLQKTKKNQGFFGFLDKLIIKKL